MFCPYKKEAGGGRKSVSHPEVGGGGGDTKRFELVLTLELEVLAIVMGREGFPPFKRCMCVCVWGGGAQTVLPCLEGGGGGAANNFQAHNFFHFVAPLPVRGDVNILYSRMTKTCWETLVTCL